MRRDLVFDNSATKYFAGLEQINYRFIAVINRKLQTFPYEVKLNAHMAHAQINFPFKQ